MAEYTTSAEDQANAAAIRQQGRSAGGRPAGVKATLDSFKQVEIDHGTFKYVLIKATDRATQREQYLVRGIQGAPYHADVARPTCSLLDRAGIPFEVVGGGRIRHDEDRKSIFIYGFSYGFGKPDHRLSADMCRKAYPDYTVDWSDEGY